FSLQTYHAVQCRPPWPPDQPPRHVPWKARQGPSQQQSAARGPRRWPSCQPLGLRRVPHNSWSCSREWRRHCRSRHPGRPPGRLSCRSCSVRRCADMTCARSSSKLPNRDQQLLQGRLQVRSVATPCTYDSGC
uniref:Uncharacterized protein n=1 Tax=Triticum urartu TaxID=4572 RepID=A0A8R7PN56_TRIUA